MNWLDYTFDPDRDDITRLAAHRFRNPEEDATCECLGSRTRQYPAKRRGPRTRRDRPGPKSRPETTRRRRKLSHPLVHDVGLPTTEVPR